MRDDSLGIPLLSSIAIHVCALLIASVVLQTQPPRRQNYFPIRLIEAPAAANPPANLTAPAETKMRPLPTKKAETSKEPQAPAKDPVVKSEKPLSSPPAARQEPAKIPEANAAAPAQAESPPSAAPSIHGENGGSEAGAGSLLSKDDADVVPGTGNGAGGDTAAFGPGRGVGATGSPGQSERRMNREAKPIQTARANYPPIALRSGLESDVILNIEVDARGNVTKAEIIKSGGAGFDDEALKAVKQSRFEPAQRDGANIAAEFTYVYRFRLKR